VEDFCEHCSESSSSIKDVEFDWLCYCLLASQEGLRCTQLSHLVNTENR
jgi:hypothetical protein